MIAKYHCPHPTEVLISVNKNGHEKSLLGTHVSLDGELYSQDENVAENDKVNPYGESEMPSFMQPPAIAKRWGDLRGELVLHLPGPQLELSHVSLQIWESITDRLTPYYTSDDVCPTPALME
jgi:hypothetical protein